MLREYQETFIRDVLNLQAMIGVGGRDKEIEDNVGNIW